MTPQQSADMALQQWQALRSLPPEIRIERFMADYFRPPLHLDLKYEDAMRAVTMEMAHDH